MSVVYNSRQLKKLFTNLAADGAQFCELRDLHSLQDAYALIQKQLHLPEHFGANLDALYDVLSNDVTGPVVMVWPDRLQSKEAMGDDYRALLNVLLDVAAQREDFVLFY